MFKTWKEARDHAQDEANRWGKDYGLEFNPIYKRYFVYGLPGVGSRFGHELTCEIVYRENVKTRKPGHGPGANVRIPG